MIEITDLLAAAVKYTPMTDLPFLTGAGNKWSSGTEYDGSASEVFNSLFSLSMQIGAMLAVFMFIWGGLQMITARDNVGNVGAGKTKMTNAVMGLLMLVSTFVVLNAINPQLTNLSLLKDVTPFKATPSNIPVALQNKTKIEIPKNDPNPLTSPDSFTKGVYGRRGNTWVQFNSLNECRTQAIESGIVDCTKVDHIKETSFPKGICGSSTTFGITISGYSCDYESITECQEDNKTACKNYSGDYVLLDINGQTQQTFSSDNPQKNNVACLDVLSKHFSGEGSGVSCKIKEK